MKFPRNARILQGRLDAAPFVAVFFLLAIFLMLGSQVYTPGVKRGSLVYIPGVKLELPAADDLPGTDRPTISVAIDANGSFYFENQWIEERQLTNRLQKAVASASEPLTLVVHADKKINYEMMLHLVTLARQSGITNALLAALPRPFAGPPARSAP
jgi:biopolymer transport protein ExbD